MGLHVADFTCAFSVVLPSRCTRASLQLFAALRFLVQSTLVTLHHVDEVGERLFFIHRYVPEVSADSLRGGKPESVKALHTSGPRVLNCAEEGAGVPELERGLGSLQNFPQCSVLQNSEALLPRGLG